MTLAFSLFIRQRGRLWICTQKVVWRNVASSADSSSFGLYSLIKYLSKKQGPWVRIFIGAALLSKMIRTVLEPRSRTSKFWIERHMLLRVRTKASTLTRRFVKSRAASILLLFTTLGARLTVWASFVFSDMLPHFLVMSSMWGCGWKGRKGGRSVPSMWGKGGCLYEIVAKVFTFVGFSGRMSQRGKKIGNSVAYVSYNWMWQLTFHHFIMIPNIN